MTRAEALEASIAHWAKNMQAQTPDEACVQGRDCALCRLFFLGVPAHLKCNDCPVKQRTGFSWCDETPYDAAAHAWYAWSDRPTRKNRATFIAAATAEHDFLVSLRETVA